MWSNFLAVLIDSSLWSSRCDNMDLSSSTPDARDNTCNTSGSKLSGNTANCHALSVLSMLLWCSSTTITNLEESEVAFCGMEIPDRKVRSDL